MGRGLQAKHKIEDKLELIICLFLYICLKTKCKLNKVIAELGKRGGAFLSQTADTPDFIISRETGQALQMCSPWVCVETTSLKEPKGGEVIPPGGVEQNLSFYVLLLKRTIS